MYKLSRFCILGLVLFSQLYFCQEVVNNREPNTIKPIYTSRIIYGSVRRATKTIPEVATNGYFTTTRNSFSTSIINNKINSNLTKSVNSTEYVSGAESITNTTSYINSTINLDKEEYGKNVNWTSGYGTHYGPFPSNPHFSEVGYQPNDVGVGCSDGRPGGDPQWKSILSKGVYPAPNIVNHENTVWPVAYTVAVSAAVWNKEDVCWKSIKIRNKNKPENVIEAYIVDFCPIGYCLWKDKYLARNVDIYGEKAWLALGADVNESNLDIEIEWPKGAIPHDAIKLSGSSLSINKSLITIFAPILTILVYIYAF
ncbi:hypothetical protein LY90DRAFT_502078 [Neocallimastix californiae]|jgi:hypothetical protein|uniref:RlpA-like protein double-psi beta-barrel domain-containing protein n=1 Tax=Neocallimastix californiae TaxID=1754190 RepID=A0A1Y2EVE1_9FUNG|nr:hypothetical protein LY90DRAFT_502078 [Neocallimastix californiae]|eukprot:ORY75530.1 hypothetical protein LY90DRAFT_502078 [Neocallimastix californiae]